MSDDMTNDADLTRADWSFSIGDGGDLRPQRFDNPLTKGLVVLVMLAVATTVLVATNGDDDATVVASGAIDSEPLAPEVAEPPATSVQEVASDIAGSDVGESGDGGAEPGNDDASSEGSVAVEQIRHVALRDQATSTTTPPTTEAPTTTAAPTTAPPDTDASTTETAPDTTVATSDGGDGTDSTTGDESTTTTAPGETTTTTAPGETTTTTAPAETTTTIASGDGWVDAGNGVLVPPVLVAIRWCESRDDYQAANPSSSARGAYQFLSGSWRAYGHADRYGVSTADQASRAQQDEAALLTWERDGTRPWNASRTCWSGRI